MAAEIGGANGMQPINWAAHIGLPVVDADGMGRAFPEIPQVTMEIAGISAVPVGADRRARQPPQHHAPPTAPGWSGSRAPCRSSSAGGASSTEYSMTAAEARTATVRGSVSLAIRIGEAMAAADEPVDALREHRRRARAGHAAS